MKPKKIILMAESNFVLDVCWERSKDCLYLARLAASGQIELWIPEFALAESYAKLRHHAAQRVERFEQAWVALRDLRPDALTPAARRRIGQALAQASDAVHRAAQLEQDALAKLQLIADEIPFTGDIMAATQLRRLRGLPPHDVKDLEIYESVLAAARLNPSPAFVRLFLERDKAHFDVAEVRQELASGGVEIYFSAGATVQRVRELMN